MKEFEKRGVLLDAQDSLAQLIELALQEEEFTKIQKRIVYNAVNTIYRLEEILYGEQTFPRRHLTPRIAGLLKRIAIDVTGDSENA